MEAIIVLWVLCYAVRNVVQDTAWKARGEDPPSYRREMERRRRRAAHEPITDRIEARRFWANAWHDAWASAAERREHAQARSAERRRAAWEREDAGTGPGGTTRDTVPDPYADPVRPSPAPPPPVRRPTTGPTTTGTGPGSGTPTGPAPKTTNAPPITGSLDVADPVTPSRPALAPAPVNAPATGPGTTTTPDPAGSVPDPAGSVDPVVQRAEAAYQRFAARGRSGAPAQRLDQVADELGVSPAEAERYIDRWRRRYASEHGVAWIGGPASMPIRDDDPGIREEDHDAGQPTSSATATAAPRLTVVPTSTNTGMETQMTTPSGETVGLQGAIAYTESMAQSAHEGVTSTETSIASLQAGQVEGEAIDALTQAMEFLTSAAAAFEAAHAALQEQIVVADAYSATPDAGSKEFVTNN
ncbi:MAG TPA: hypothetical protein VGD91_12970 [Trebonia sp.]